MKKLEKSSLTARAISVIRREIISQRWQLGERLPNEATLCEILDVSRGTVREAVRVLVAEGLLETRQGSGTYVVSNIDVSGPLTLARRAGLRDQFEARCALEVEATRLAAIRRTPEVVVGLRRLLAERGSFDGKEKTSFVERDLAFHRAVIAASGNQALVEIYQFFSSSIAETIAATLEDDLPEPDMQAHAGIVDAIEAGNADAACDAVRRFMAPVLSSLDRLMSS
jgi:DNA-binding FadR family transcriptional regulator